MNLRLLEDFDELLDIFMPWESGVAVMLRAFFDASTRETDTFCVAGFAFGADRAKKAEREWRSLMGDRIGHLTDLSARRGDFSDLEKEQPGDLLKGQVRIIREYRSLGVAMSCSLKEIGALLPKNTATGDEQFLDGFRRAYAVCCHLAMHTLGRMSQQHSGSSAGIAYIFESGDEFQSESSRFIEHAITLGPTLRHAYGYRSHGYMAKRDARLLETADVLAWEWAKHIDRMREGKPVRPSLRALIGGNLLGDEHRTEIIVALHLSGHKLERFCDKVGRLLLATEHSQIAAIVSSCVSDDQP